MKRIKVTATLPEDLVEVIDQSAEQWYSNRTKALTRIVLEWTQLRAKQLPLAVADENPQENPTEQMKKNGAAPLVEA